MRWRKATLANIIWNGLMAWLLVGGLQNTQLDSAETFGVFSIIAVGMAVWFLLVIWFIGFIVLALIWLVSQPKRNTAVYGPQRQQMMVTEKEAKRRVEREGWSYYPQPPYPQQQHQGQQAPQGGGGPLQPPAGPGQP